VHRVAATGAVRTVTREVAKYFATVRDLEMTTNAERAKDESEKSVRRGWLAGMRGAGCRGRRGWSSRRGCFERRRARDDDASKAMET
jgi:hypothetical protein